MQSNWAAENLQVIRTLMERSALYRRALAPVMWTVGIIGSVAGIAAYFFKIKSEQSFVLFWLVTSVVALVSSFALIRRQALKDAEPFWSPPTRRVASALAPLFVVGFLFGILVLLSARGTLDWFIPAWALPGIWMILYGCALHSAGFFMARGIRWLGWLFIISGIAALLAKGFVTGDPLLVCGHFWMAAVFGGLQLAYGIYLYFTEKKKTVA